MNSTSTYWHYSSHKYVLSIHSFTPLIDFLIKYPLMSLSTCWEIQYFVLLLHFQLSRDLIVFIISFISSFDIVIIVISDRKISFFFFLFAAVNPNGITRLLANGFSTFFIKDKSIFSNVPESQPKLSPDCSILDNWVFDNFILTDEQFEKALRSVESWLLLTNNSFMENYSHY